MLTIALAGNPNTGKTVLFNRLTGLRNKVANYPGVTVEEKSGNYRFDKKKETEILDLPGIYSLSKYSEDTKVSTDILTGHPEAKRKIDKIICVLDACHLQRNLSLALQMKDLKVPFIVVINMSDELAARGGDIDVAALKKYFGTEVFLISAVKGWGMKDFFSFMATWTSKVEKFEPQTIKKEFEDYVVEANTLGEKSYRKKISSDKVTDKLDGILLHGIFGPIVFLISVVIVFQSIFSWAVPLMDGVELFIGYLGEVFTGILPEGLFRSLVVDAVINGVGAVIVFLPQIIILFILIGFMEYSGYMARAAFVMDRVMKGIGLEGRSFLPLLSSYACAVPGVMAARTIESKVDRFVTIFIAPFMTCSARLPVYILLITAFIPNHSYLGGAIGLRSLVMIGLYLLGIVVAVFTAWLLKKSFLKGDKLPFIMEIPSYRLPQLREMLKFTMDRALIFLKKAGRVILVATVFLWVLATFPQTEGKTDIEKSYAGQFGKIIEPAIEPLGFNWKIGVGILTSLAAREVIVSTLATLYKLDEADDEGLVFAIQKDLTLPGALSLLIFFVLAMQCFSTTAIVKRETGGWTIPLLQIFYMTGLAYVLSFAVFQIATRYYI